MSSRARLQGSRANSLPYRHHYLAAMLGFFLHLLSVLAAATLLYIVLDGREARAVDGLIVAVAVVAATWLMTFFFRRAARCPLCRGTPLYDNGTVKHAKARRLKPLNHGFSAMVSLLFTQRFRCMDCGTPFDLMKRPKHMASKAATSDPENRR